MSFEGGNEKGDNVERMPIRPLRDNLFERHGFALDFVFAHDPRENEKAAFEQIKTCVDQVQTLIEEIDRVEQGAKERRTLRDEAIQAYNHLTEALEDAQQLINVRTIPGHE